MDPATGQSVIDDWQESMDSDEQREDADVHLYERIDHLSGIDDWERLNDQKRRSKWVFVKLSERGDQCGGLSEIRFNAGKMQHRAVGAELPRGEYVVLWIEGKDFRGEKTNPDFYVRICPEAQKRLALIKQEGDHRYEYP